VREQVVRPFEGRGASWGEGDPQLRICGAFFAGALPPASKLCYFFGTVPPSCVTCNFDGLKLS
jgi:hypothetical protein